MTKSIEFAKLAAGRSDKLSAALVAADHVDVKIAVGRADLAGFLYGMLAEKPGWVRALYGLRCVLARCMGLKQEIECRVTGPQDLSLEPGTKVSFFLTLDCDEETFWLGEGGDKHLSSMLAVVREPMVDDAARFHVATVVRYKNWLGPVYFNLIRPFHHLIVGRMAWAGAAYGDE